MVYFENLPLSAHFDALNFQNSPKPIMLRGPRSGLYVGQYNLLFISFPRTEDVLIGVYGVLFATGMLATTYSIVNMVKVRKLKVPALALVLPIVHF